MHEGALSRRQIQGWVLNRYYYQTRIPIKDALILSKSEDPSFRRLWIHRIHDHDGTKDGEGGLALWLRLAEGVGLDRAEVASLGARRARRALRVRRLRRAGARAEPARGGGVVAHRVLRARHHVAPHRRLGAALSLDRRRHARLLPQPRHARPRRLARGHRLRDRPRDHPRGAGGVRRRADPQVRDPLGDARRDRGGLPLERPDGASRAKTGRSSRARRASCATARRGARSCSTRSAGSRSTRSPPRSRGGSTGRARGGDRGGGRGGVRRRADAARWSGTCSRSWRSWRRGG